MKIEKLTSKELCVLDTVFSSGLIPAEWSKAWADELILQCDEADYWLTFCSLHGGSPFGYVETLDNYNACPSLKGYAQQDAVIACWLYQSRQGHLKWGDFLLKAGQLADGGAGRIECDCFFMALNTFEESDKPEELEVMQRTSFAETYEDILPLIDQFIDFYRFYEPLSPRDEMEEA